MTDQIIKLADDSSNTGKKLDTEELVVGANTVQRERIQITGSAAAAISSVLNANPAGTEYGLIVRNIPSGTQPISGSVAVSNAYIDVRGRSTSQTPGDGRTATINQWM